MQKVRKFQKVENIQASLHRDCMQHYQSVYVYNRCCDAVMQGHGKVTQHRPEVILNNFTTRLGHSVARLLAAWFPQVPQFQGRRVVTFHNQRDFIFLRHHRYDIASCVAEQFSKFCSLPEAKTKRSKLLWQKLKFFSCGCLMLHLWF